VTDARAHLGNPRPPTSRRERRPDNGADDDRYKQENSSIPSMLPIVKETRYQVLRRTRREASVADRTGSYNDVAGNAQNATRDKRRGLPPGT
jgi:hypothetical protein